MFGVIENNFAVVFEKLDRVGDHGQVFIRRDAEHFGHMQKPRFAHDGDNRCLRFEQLTHQVVFFDTHAFAASHAERGDLGIFELAAFGLLKELHVLGIGAWPAALNVLNPE